MRMALLLGMFVGVIFCAVAGAAEPRQVDIEKTAQRGQAILDRLEKEAASWTSTSRFESGATLRVKVIQEGERSRKSFEFQSGGRWISGLQIIERDGLWYGSNDTLSRKCRPYELNAGLPVIYFLLERAMPAVISDPQKFGTAKLEKVDKQIAILHVPLTAANKNQIQTFLTQFEKLKSEFGKSLPSELDQRVRKFREWSEKGQPVHVDLETGIVVGHGDIKAWTEITELQFLPEAPKGAFEVDDRQWDDYTDDPTTGNVDQLAMIGFQPGFKVGQKNRDTELVLIDVQAERLRRVPFEGVEAAPGCFLPGRKSVVVHGKVSATGGLAPYRVDLQTGENTPIAEEAFRGVNTVGATLSPNGKTLALVRMNAGEILKSQIYLIDLATDEATPLGEPLDVFYLSWFPDGKRLLVRVMEHIEGKDELSRWVGTIDLQGKLTKLFPGDAPFFAGSPLRIVFEDEDDKWFSCNPDATDVKPYADGFKGYRFPAPSPDGRQALMMRFEKGKLPVPTLLDIGKSSGRPISKLEGLWAMPAWK